MKCWTITRELCLLHGMRTSHSNGVAAEIRAELFRSLTSGLKGYSPGQVRLLSKMLHDLQRARLAEVLPKAGALQTMYTMRHQLAALWGRSTATSEQLVKQLQDWCRRAEASGIAPLAEFSQRLRSYA